MLFPIYSLGIIPHLSILYDPAVYRAHFWCIRRIILLLVIAYDCYVAICGHLHYLVIMRQRVCVMMLVMSWVEGFLYSVIQFGTIYGLPFCGS